MTPYLVLDQVTKMFAATEAVRGVNLSIYKGEFFSLLGGSGCGKSTLLRLIAGLESPTSGRIYLEGEDITDLPSYKRPVNMMFQSYALFPHMTVFENIAFGLKQEGLNTQEIYDRIQEGLGWVQMRGFEHRYPRQLSGGQQQRVALVRSLVKRPKVLLLDEPLGALDQRLREQTQFELLNLQERLGTTFLMVTHDQDEAMTLSSRIGVMDDGKLCQVGLPHDVYETPINRFVAAFIGGMNFFEAQVDHHDLHHTWLRSAHGFIRIPVDHALSIGAHVGVGVRPEKIWLTAIPPQNPINTFQGVIEDIAYSGDRSLYHVTVNDQKRFVVAMTNSFRCAERSMTYGQSVFGTFPGENILIFRD